MEFSKPKVELWLYDNVYDHIARCARVCYASNKTSSNIQMCKRLWDNNHRSMFRHAGVYYIIPVTIFNFDINNIYAIVAESYDKIYVSTNEQAAREYWDIKYLDYRITQEEAMFNKVFIKNQMLRYTFCIETGIDITREYNRKSPNNISEQSTRYVDFIKKIGIKFKECHWMIKCNFYQRLLYTFISKVDEWFYKISRSKYGLNLPPEDARWCLFLNTMSKVVYTYSVQEWEYIINLRKFDYTGKAHSDAKIIANKIYNELTNLGYTIENYK